MTLEQDFGMPLPRGDAKEIDPPFPDMHYHNMKHVLVPGCWLPAKITGRVKSSSGLTGDLGH